MWVHLLSQSEKGKRRIRLRITPEPETACSCILTQSLWKRHPPRRFLPLEDRGGGEMGGKELDDSCASVLCADEPGRHLYSIPARSCRWGGTPLSEPLDFQEPLTHRVSRFWLVTSLPSVTRTTPASRRVMEERENLVYQAKLAEQAERYDGKPRLERLAVSRRVVDAECSFPLRASQLAG